MRYSKALVLGGSISGLLAARVLSEHFSEVLILERDKVTGLSVPRKGVPQDRHAHGLLTAGLCVIERLFPQFRPRLVAQGAITGDICRDGVWHQFGQAKLRIKTGQEAILISRPRLESTVREFTLSTKNVSLLEKATVTGLCFNSQNMRVTGARVNRESIQGEETIEADLIVDATGSASRCIKWLSDAGFTPPPETRILIDLTYATRVYQRATSTDNAYMACEPPPSGRRGCAVLAQEGQRWLVTLFGFGGYSPTAQPSNFVEFAQHLPLEEVRNLVSKGEPLSEIALYHFKANVRRHFERMTKLPTRFVVVGDALCRFNPMYGQGMTVAALEAELLHRCLTKIGTLDELALHFFAEAKTLLNVPWQLASCADLGYSSAEGHRTYAWRLMHSYLARLHNTCSHDTKVTQAFFEVANLTAPASRLFKPDIIRRVMLSGLSEHTT